MSVTSGLKEKFKPVLNVVSLQAKASKEILGEQVNFMRECVNVSSRHADELRGKSDPSAALRMPIDVGLEISGNWLSTLGRQWDILAKTGSGVTGEFKSAKEEIKATASNAESAKAGSTAKSEAGSRKS